VALVFRFSAAAALLGLAACTQPGPVEPGPTEDPSSDPAEAPDPGAPELKMGTLGVVIDGLRPGWLVTTSRLSDGNAAVETTQVSDGSPLTLAGTPEDIFVATVTDGDGKLLASQAMGAPCTLVRSHQLRVPADFATIQAAIDAAQPGETVAVAPGTYTESVKLRTGVCLLGSGARSTVLDARGEGRTLVDLTGAPGSVVAGFTMRGVTMPPGCSSDVFDCSGDWYRAAVYLGGTDWRDPTQDAPALIIGNVFEDNDVGVMLYWRGVAIVRNNVFRGNRSGLVANHFQSHTLVANNVFLANTELAIGNQAAFLDLIENVIAGSELGVRFMYVQTGAIRFNAFFGNRMNANEGRFTIGEDGNIEVDPRFVDPAAGDFHLQPGSPAIDAGRSNTTFEPDGTPHDIGAYGGPLAAWAKL